VTFAATIETRALALLRQAEREACPRPGIPVTARTDRETAAWLKEHSGLLTDFTRRTGSRLIIS